MSQETFVENMSNMIESEMKNLRLTLEQINIAKKYISYGEQMVPPHHPRIKRRMEIIKEELILLSVIVENEAGLITASDALPDTDPAPDEEPTQVNLELPEPT